MSVLDSVATTVSITDGRVEMTAEADATVYIDTPEQTPLSSRQTFATIRAEGDDHHTEIVLDADGVEQVADALGAATTREGGE